MVGVIILFDLNGLYVSACTEEFLCTYIPTRKMMVSRQNTGGKNSCIYNQLYCESSLKLEIDIIADNISHEINSVN